MTDTRHGAEHNQTPEDVTTLYSFSNVHGAKYRDFSASRSEARAQFNRRMLREQAAFTRKAQEQAAPREVAAPEKHLHEEASGVEGPAESGPPTPLTPSSGEAPTAPAPILDQERGQEKEELVYREAVSEPSYAPGADTPIETKQNAASRWFVLKEFFPQEKESTETPGIAPSKEDLPPVAAVFSLAGGVGKTSLVATLGRALAAYGERVLLAETASFGLLPLYFGSQAHRSGVVRTFSPPKGNSADAPVHIVTLEPGQPPRAGDPLGDPLLRDSFLEELIRDGRGSSRILIDIQTASRRTAQRLLPLAPTLLVPLLPDMSSVMSLDSVQAVFGRGAESESASGPRWKTRRVEPVYLLNQFDESLPLHVDVREILGRQLGNRLLPFVVRHSPLVSEALAEGMTVMDYAPGSPVAEDYLQLAGWLLSVSAAAPAGFDGVRWSER